MSPVFIKNYLPLIYLLSGLLPILTAQSLPKMETLNIEDGLVIRDVSGIAQDSAGFIWLGTDQGINRYDGYQFKLYNSDKNNPNFIEKEKVTGGNFFYHPNHEIWFVANEQLFRLDILTDSVTAFGSQHGLKGDVLKLHLDAKGQLWMITDDNWHVSKGNAHQYLQQWIAPDSFRVVAKTKRGNREFTSITTDRDNNLWWGTIMQGILTYSESGELISQIKPDSFSWFGEKMYFAESFFDRQNQHYYFPKDKKGVWRFDDRSQRFIPLLHIDQVVYQALEDHLGNLWFATMQDLFRVEPNGQITDFTPKLKEVLDIKIIKQLYQDQAKVLWVVTDNGLIKIRVKNQLFDNFLQTDKSGWGNSMRSILEAPNGDLLAWCSTTSTMYRIDQNDQVSTIPLPEHPENPDPTFHGARFFSIDKNGEHLYTVNKNLIKLRLSDAKVSIDNRFSERLNITTANPLIRLRDGRLLFGYSLKKLTLYDPANDHHQLVFSEEELPKDISGLRFFLESKTPGIVWIGTNSDGLFKIHLNGTIKKQYNSSTDPALSKNNVLVIHEAAADQSLWIGVYGGGLNQLFTEKDAIVIYQQRDGLPDNNVVGILPFEEDKLWISTYNGLSCFNKNTKVFQNYFEEDGLTHNEFNYTSFFSDSRGRFYFGGMNGLNRFTPGTITQKEKLPPLKFTGLSRFNSKTNTTTFLDFCQQAADQLIISPKDQYFQIYWTFPNYFQSKKNQYYTKLEGFEEDWTFQGYSNFIRYNQLPAGEYTLRVKGSDSRGNESSSQLRLPIIVRPVFYRTWWFISLCVLMLTGIIYTIFQYRLQQLLALERLRTKISSDLHDNVGSLLSGLAMQSEILEMNAREEDKARLHHITEISRNAVTQMRDLVWSIDARRDKVADLLERMQELAEELLLPADISYQLEKDEHINLNKKLPINIRQNLFMIYKEAINNILRHSNADHVHIRLYNQGNHFYLTIRDNGNNKQKAYKTTGLGLANMSMRAERMKGEIQFDHQEGFVVRLSLPRPL